MDHAGDHRDRARSLREYAPLIIRPSWLLPGMPVEVYVTTDSRTALSYLIKPVADQMNQAFTER